MMPRCHAAPVALSSIWNCLRTVPPVPSQARSTNTIPTWHCILVLKQSIFISLPCYYYTALFQTWHSVLALNSLSYPITITRHYFLTLKYYTNMATTPTFHRTSILCPSLLSVLTNDLVYGTVSTLTSSRHCTSNWYLYYTFHIITYTWTSHSSTLASISSFTHAFTSSPTHSLTHLLIPSFTLSPARSLTHT